MGRPCGHIEELERGKPYEAGSCRLCWLYFNNEGYKTMWDAQPTVPPPTPSLKLSPEEIRQKINEGKDCGCGKKS